MKIDRTYNKRDNKRGESTVRGRRLFMILALGLVLLMGGLLTACSDESDEADTAGDSAGLTDFSAETFDGAGYGPEDMAAHDLTVMNIWATWCGYCVEEMPALANVEKSLPDNVALVTYCTDGMEEKGSAEKILKETGFEGSVLYNGQGDLATMIDQIMSYPTTVFLDRKGNQVIDPVVGAPQDPETAYKDAINKALGELGLDPIE